MKICIQNDSQSSAVQFTAAWGVCCLASLAKSPMLASCCLLKTRDSNPYSGKTPTEINKFQGPHTDAVLATWRMPGAAFCRILSAAALPTCFVPAVALPTCPVPRYYLLAAPCTPVFVRCFIWDALCTCWLSADRLSIVQLPRVALCTCSKYMLHFILSFKKCFQGKYVKIIIIKEILPYPVVKS